MMRYLTKVPATAVAVVTIMVMMAGSVAGAGTVLNGNFSANAAQFVKSPGYVMGGNADIAGWEASHAPYVGLNGKGTGFYAALHAPFMPASTRGVHNFAFLQHRNTWIRQTVGTVAGRSYTLTYKAAQRFTDTKAVVQTKITDATRGAKIAVQKPAINDQSFKSFTLKFTAGSALTTISFVNISSAGDNTVDISHVSLAAVQHATGKR